MIQPMEQALVLNITSLVRPTRDAKVADTARSSPAASIDYPIHSRALWPFARRKFLACHNSTANADTAPDQTQHLASMFFVAYDARLHAPSKTVTCFPHLTQTLCTLACLTCIHRKPVFKHFPAMVNPARWTCQGSPAGGSRHPCEQVQ
jgi:hypothetical protein